MHPGGLSPLPQISNSKISSESDSGVQELEYPDGHTSRSIYVGMPLVRLGEKVPEGARDHLEGASLAIWTTTPWTLPANAAVAVNADLRYCVAQVEVRASLTLYKEICTPVEEEEERDSSID